MFEPRDYFSSPRLGLHWFHSTILGNPNERPVLAPPTRQADAAEPYRHLPMCQYWAVDGAPTPWHLIHYGTLAASGAAALFVEATAVEADVRITPGDLGLWDDRTEAALQPVLSAVRQFSPIAVIMQLG